MKKVTIEFTRRTGNALDGRVLGTVEADHMLDAAEQLSKTEVKLWGSVWLRYRGQKVWWEHKFD